MQEKTRVIISGGRDFDNYILLEKRCDYILKDEKKVIIISGMAKGADTLAVKYARKRGYELEAYHAKWNIYGNNAGFIRNEEMARVGDLLISFWDGKSRGTRDMITRAKEHRIPTHVIYYNQEGLNE